MSNPNDPNNPNDSNNHNESGGSNNPYDPYSSGSSGNGNSAYDPYGSNAGSDNSPRGPEDSPQWGQQWNQGNDQQAYGGQPYGGQQYGGQQYGGPAYGHGEQPYGGQPYGNGQPSYGYGDWQRNAAGADTLAPGVRMPGGDEPPVNPVVQGPTKVSISNAFSTAFRYLNSSLGTWLGGMVLFGGILLAMTIVAVGVLTAQMGFDPNFDPENPPIPTDEQFQTMMTGMIVMILVMVVFMFLMQLFLLRGAFEVIDGRQSTFGAFFKLGRWGSMIGVYIVTFLVELVCVLPGFLLFFGGGVLTGTTGSGGGAVLMVLGYALIIALTVAILPVISTMPLLVMDGQCSALEAPVVAWRAVKPQYWTMLGAYILVSLVSAAGTMLFYIGVLYTMPLAMIVQVHVYRQLVGGRRVVPNMPQAQGYYPPQQGY